MHPFNGDASVKANAGNYNDVETAVAVDVLLSQRLVQLGHGFRGEDEDDDPSPTADSLQVTCTIPCDERDVVCCV